MTNEIQKQYDRLDDVPSIMIRIKVVYVVPDRHIRYAATKAFFGTKMAEGSSVQSHGIKMLFLVEKLEDLKAGLNNDTYIDVILQSLPPSYDPFIINYNMNELEKSIHELINMLIQYEATTKGQAVAATASTGGAPAAPTEKGQREGWGSQRLRANDVCMYCQGKGHWKRECPQLLSNPDVCKPLNTLARGGFSYFITFNDDHSRYDYVYLMRYSLRPLEGSRNTDLKLRIKLATRLKPFDRTEVDYAFETAAKFLNIAPSKTVPRTPYEIWHGKPASYKCLKVWQLDRTLDGGHEINCLGLGLKRSKSRTLKMGIESLVETCTKSRIH
ncbi:UNVERIFIED_CONTAM: hypothetical protein Slati_2434100 [Sesamum latifolium]|uniref:CCHC-type domain-containing protein n=1 Tax=Sesamum latifolium TaxID=2727402 RepID=A0AAW2WHR0_9LAMI